MTANPEEEIELPYYWLEDKHQIELKQIVRRAFSKKDGFLVSNSSAKLTLSVQPAEESSDEEYPE